MYWTIETINAWNIDYSNSTNFLLKKYKLHARLHQMTSHHPFLVGLDICFHNQSQHSLTSFFQRVSRYLPCWHFVAIVALLQETEEFPLWITEQRTAAVTPLWNFWIPFLRNLLYDISNGNIIFKSIPVCFVRAMRERIRTAVLKFTYYFNYWNCVDFYQGI